MTTRKRSMKQKVQIWAAKLNGSERNFDNYKPGKIWIKIIEKNRIFLSKNYNPVSCNKASLLEPSESSEKNMHQPNKTQTKATIHLQSGQHPKQPPTIDHHMLSSNKEELKIEHLKHSVHWWVRWNCFKKCRKIIKAKQIIYRKKSKMLQMLIWLQEIS